MSEQIKHNNNSEYDIIWSDDNMIVGGGNTSSLYPSMDKNKNNNHDTSTIKNQLSSGHEPVQQITPSHNDNNNSSNDSYNKLNNSSNIYLTETFYITSKKNTVFQVKLNDFGLNLRKESNGTSKEQTILIKDIFGCRCLRSKRKKNDASACACSSIPRPGHFKAVDDHTLDLIDETDVSAYLYIYAYVLKKNRRGVSNRRERTTITLRFRSFDKYEDNYKEGQKWCNSIKYLLNKEFHLNEYNNNHSGLSGGGSSLTTTSIKDPRKILVIINPKSGSGKARELFQQRVSPMLNESEIQYDLHVTKYANFAREFVRKKDIYQWKFIVVVGGDGIFYEVINGLFERVDWEHAIEQIPIGIIPCGSGNGLAKTISHLFNEPYDPKPVLSAALTVIRGLHSTMDLVRVETRSQIMFSFLSVGWGLISDIDIESERLRAIGYPRFTIWSVHRLISLRTYHGRISYKPISYLYKNDQSMTTAAAAKQLHTNKIGLKHSISYNSTLECSECHGNGNNCEKCDTEFGDVLALETTSNANGGVGGGGGNFNFNQQFGSNNSNTTSYRPRLDSWYSATSRKSTYFSTDDQSLYQSVTERNSNCGSDSPTMDKRCPVQMNGPASTIPALTAPVPDSWTIENGEFVMVHAAYQTHLGSDCYFAPASQLNDGIIWLLIIRGGASRQELLKFLLGLSTGTHLPTTKNPYIEMIPCSAFRIEPSGTQGYCTVDGERVEYGPMQGEIFCGLAKVLTPYRNDMK